MTDATSDRDVSGLAARTEMLETEVIAANIYLKNQLPRPGSDVGGIGDDCLGELQEQRNAARRGARPYLSGVRELGYQKGHGLLTKFSEDWEAFRPGAPAGKWHGVCGLFGLVGFRPWRHQPLHTL